MLLLSPTFKNNSNKYIELTFWSWTDACEKLMHKSTIFSTLSSSLSMHAYISKNHPDTKHFIHSSSCELRLCTLWHSAKFYWLHFGRKIFQFCERELFGEKRINSVRKNSNESNWAERIINLENWDCVKIRSKAPSPVTVVNN